MIRARAISLSLSLSLFSDILVVHIVICASSIRARGFGCDPCFLEPPSDHASCNATNRHQTVVFESQLRVRFMSKLHWKPLITNAWEKLFAGRSTSDDLMLCQFWRVRDVGKSVKSQLSTEYARFLVWFRPIDRVWYDGFWIWGHKAAQGWPDQFGVNSCQLHVVESVWDDAVLTCFGMCQVSLAWLSKDDKVHHGLGMSTSGKRGPLLKRDVSLKNGNVGSILY